MDGANAAQCIPFHLRFNLFECVDIDMLRMHMKHVKKSRGFGHVFCLSCVRFLACRFADKLFNTLHFESRA